MKELLPQVWRLLEKTPRGRWIVLIGLCAAVSLFEAIGALLIYALLSLASSSGSSLTLPLVGDLRHRFPGLSHDQLLLYLAIAVAVFFLVRGATAVTQSYLQNRVAQGIAVVLADRLIGGYLDMPYELHLARNSPEMIRNAHQSVLEVATYILVPGVQLLSESFIVIGMCILLVASSPIATGLALAILGPIVFLIFRVIQPRLGRLGEDAQEASADSLRLLQESFVGVRDVKVSGTAGYFRSIFGRVRTRLARSLYLRQVFGDAPRIILETALILFLVAFVAITTTNGENTGHTLAVLGLFGYAAIRLLPSINRIVTATNAIKYGAASARNVDTELQLISGTSEPTATSPHAMPFEHELRVENLSFRYRNSTAPVLSGISLTVPKGTSLGIVGPTGAGKTTLVDIMIGLLPPTTGRVIVDGTDIQSDVRAWQRRLGIVPQTVFLIDDTLRRNVALGLDDSEIDGQRVRDAVQLAQLDSVVAELPNGLETRVAERGIRLSGGQRQRVAIARALYRQPSLLVFDEGTSALDHLTENELVKAVESLRGERTIILVAHRLSTIRRCDQVAFLDKGELVDLGSYEELVARNNTFKALAALV